MSSYRIITMAVALVVGLAMWSAYATWGLWAGAGVLVAGLALLWWLTGVLKK